jgi:hypothetical protein
MGNPHGNSVDKLLALFKQTKNASFVYLLHKYNSGFVTIQKNLEKPMNRYSNYSIIILDMITRVYTNGEISSN